MQSVVQLHGNSTYKGFILVIGERNCFCPTKLSSFVTRKFEERPISTAQNFKTQQLDLHKSFRCTTSSTSVSTHSKALKVGNCQL